MQEGMRRAMGARKYNKAPKEKVFLAEGTAWQGACQFIFDMQLRAQYNKYPTLTLILGMNDAPSSLAPCFQTRTAPIAKPNGPAVKQAV